jgi:hypothetical protein
VSDQLAPGSQWIDREAKIPAGVARSVDPGDRVRRRVTVISTSDDGEAYCHGQLSPWVNLRSTWEAAGADDVWLPVCSRIVYGERSPFTTGRYQPLEEGS